MDHKLQLIAILASAGLLLMVLELVLRRALLERYALAWLGSAVVLLVLAVWSGLLQRVSDALGIAAATNALFFLAVTAILALLLHFSVAVSRLTDQAKVLAQRHALLEERLRRLEAADEQPAPPAGETAGDDEYVASGRRFS